MTHDIVLVPIRARCAASATVSYTVRDSYIRLITLIVCESCLCGKSHSSMTHRISHCVVRSSWLVSLFWYPFEHNALHQPLCYTQFVTLLIYYQIKFVTDITVWIPIRERRAASAAVSYKARDSPIRLITLSSWCIASFHKVRDSYIALCAASGAIQCSWLLSYIITHSSWLISLSWHPFEHGAPHQPLCHTQFVTPLIYHYT